MKKLLILNFALIWMLTGPMANAQDFEWDPNIDKEIYTVVKSNQVLHMDLVQKTRCIGVYKMVSGPEWLVLYESGLVRGIPNDSHEGYNDFYITCTPENGDEYNIHLLVYVDCGG